MSEEQLQPTFSVERIYVKDLSLEAPDTPAAHFEQGQPRVEISLQTRGHGVAENLYEVVLTVSVKAATDARTLFLVEVAQAGLFQLRNLPEDSIEPTLGIACPNILYPYAREAVSAATVSAGFAPVVLQPVNFEQMWLAQQNQPEQAQ